MHLCLFETNSAQILFERYKQIHARVFKVILTLMHILLWSVDRFIFLKIHEIISETVKLKGPLIYVYCEFKRF